MKPYKEYDKIYIGESDIASLILAGYKDGVGLSLKELHFGGDGGYQAYITDDQAEIGSHYELVETFQVWLKVYDDSGLTAEFNGEEIKVYRAKEMGCIIQVTPKESKDRPNLEVVINPQNGLLMVY